jgi:hypothetical protein
VSFFIDPAKLSGMSDIDLAVNRSKRLEHLLEQNAGATGKGLHQKVSSVESKLAPELVRKIRLVATVRNKLVHEDDYKKIDDRAAFTKASDEAERELKAMAPGGKGHGKLILLAVGLILVIAVYLLFKSGKP